MQRPHSVRSLHRGWCILLGLGLAAAGAGWASRGNPSEQMAAAATHFLEALAPDLRAKANLPFDSPARLDWHYVPRERPGVSFAMLNDAQRIAARDLLRSALSSTGMGKVEAIISLEDVLRQIESGAGPARDALAYSFVIFGTPGESPWGWKCEGHHVSLNFTGAGPVVASTPAFLGANPAEVKSGPRAGLRVLRDEEDLARDLLRSFNAEQMRKAMLGTEAPGDILAVPGRALTELDQTGLAVKDMDEAQTSLVERLIHEYVQTLRHEFAQNELDRINAAGLGSVRFAWMGGVEPGQGHYYRLAGPTFVIEYDNTQNHANHVHTVWRDRERDFGADLLRQHIEHDHSHSPR